MTILTILGWTVSLAILLGGTAYFVSRGNRGERAPEESMRTTKPGEMPERTPEQRLAKGEIDLQEYEALIDQQMPAGNATRNQDLS